MTFVADAVALNIIYEGILPVLSRALSKERNQFKTRAQKPCPIYEHNMAKLDILCVTKTAEKPFPLGRKYLIEIQGSTPPPSPP